MTPPKHTYRVTWFVEEPSCRQWQQRYFSNREEAMAFMEGLRADPANVSISMEALP